MRLRGSRLSELQTRNLLAHFVAGTPARAAAQLVGVNRNTATRIYRVIRERIAAQVTGTTAAAMSREAGGDTAPDAVILVDGTVCSHLFVRGKRVHIQALSPRVAATGEPATSGDALSKTQSSLVLRRVRRPQPDAENFGVVENFWRQALRQLRRYNGIPNDQIPLFLKECAWRFNTGSSGQLLAALTGLLSQK